MKKIFRNYLTPIIIITLLFSNFIPYALSSDAHSDTEVIICAKSEDDIPKILQLTSSFGDNVTYNRSTGNYLLINVNNSKYNTVINTLQNSDYVTYAQLNHTYYVDNFPNDENFKWQWYLNNEGEDITYGRWIYETTADVDVDALDAWEYYHGDKEVVVAVIDTGIDYKHPDLTDIMWTNQDEIPDNNIDDDNNGYIDDYYGWNFYNNNNITCYYSTNPRTGIYSSDFRNNDDHGTHCAGVIAASANNDIGIAGTASNIPVRIMSIKALGGRDGAGSTFSIIESIKYAELMGAKICNMSWNSTLYDEMLRTIMSESSMLFITASGNSSSNNDKTPTYPANFDLDNIITVASVDAQGNLSSFSNYGKESVDIAAPGEQILSTTVNDYSFMDGTSMSAPIVTAIAAMLYSMGDGLYASNVKDILLGSYKELSDLEGKISVPGIISAYKAVQNSKGLIQDHEPPNISLSLTTDSSYTYVKASINDIGSSGIRAFKWMKGTYTADDFKKGLKGDSIISSDLILETKGNYTFYASDYAGNETVEVITANDVKTVSAIVNAKSITLSKSKKTLSPGETFTLKYTITPKKATETVTFTSSNKKVATVNKSGKITARKKGTATIKAVTSSGKKASCKITVK